MKRFSYDDLPVSRWRNGGGETREIMSFPPGKEQFGWRASIATISADGPFSLFPHVDRVITLLHGDDVLLSAPGVQHRLTPLQPWAFSGELALSACLNGSASEDFNIMTRRDSWQATVAITSTLACSENGVAWVLSGEWQLANGEKLSRQQGVWWTDETMQLRPGSDDAQLLFICLSRVL
ncbi:HutD family protein [Mixta mediterraneensis]|uniref:HutD/Ves family protein n=1 Tax=Mixta mediterraneensis TaxID=2758443 RepID=UPI001875F97C|nr:HutD family protein [Mixta mediterraneensis]MBE5250860.1 HutD family protein [Mixta mediterraneensis]